MAFDNLTIKYNKISFSDDYLNMKLFATQHDTGRVFYFQILDDTGQPYNATGHTLEFYISIKGKAGKVVGTAIDLANGKFKVAVPNSLLIFHGTALAQLQLKKGLDKIGTILGELDIEKSIESGATIGKDIWIDFAEIQANVEAVKNLDVYKQITELSTLNDNVSATIKRGNTTILTIEDYIKDTERLKGNIESELRALNSSKDEVVLVINRSATAKSNLENTISDANLAFSKLSGTDTELKATIKEAKTTDATLKATDVKAESTDLVVKNTIKDAESRKTLLEQGANAKLGEVDGAITRLDRKIKEADGLFDPIQIVDDLVTGGADKALSAEQGKKLFTLASEAKNKVVTALLAKGQDVNTNMTFQQLSEIIQTMKIGYEVGDVVKSVQEIRGDSSDVSGTIPTNAAVENMVIGSNTLIGKKGDSLVVVDLSEIKLIHDKRLPYWFVPVGITATQIHLLAWREGVKSLNRETLEVESQSLDVPWMKAGFNNSIVLLDTDNKMTYCDIRGNVLSSTTVTGFHWDNPSEIEIEILDDYIILTKQGAETRIYNKSCELLYTLSTTGLRCDLSFRTKFMVLKNANDNYLLNPAEPSLTTIPIPEDVRKIVKFLYKSDNRYWVLEGVRVNRYIVCFDVENDTSKVIWRKPYTFINNGVSNDDFIVAGVGGRLDIFKALITGYKILE